MRPARLLVADRMAIFRACGCRFLLSGCESGVTRAGLAGEARPARRAAGASADRRQLSAGGRVRGRGVAHLPLQLRADRLEPDAEQRRGSRCGPRRRAQLPVQGDFRRRLVRAWLGAAHGDTPFPHGVATLMIDALHGLTACARACRRRTLLSPRDHPVLDLIAKGESTSGIMELLAGSEFTFERYVRNTLRELRLGSHGAAAASYRETLDGSGDVYAALIFASDDDRPSLLRSLRLRQSLSRLTTKLRRRQRSRVQKPRCCRTSPSIIVGCGSSGEMAGAKAAPRTHRAGRPDTRFVERYTDERRHDHECAVGHPG